MPGLSNFHDPARFLLYTTFAFAALTAAGWDSAAKRLRCVALTRGSALAQRWILIAGQSLGLFALAAPLLWYGQEWNPTAPHDLLQRRPARFDALLAAQNNMLDAQNDPPYPRNKPSAPRAGRIYLPAADIFWKRYITEGYRDYGASDPRHIRALIDSALPNISIADGLLSASGYEPVPVSAQTALDGIGRQALRRSEPNLARVTALLNACALLLPGTVTLHDPRFRPLPALQPSPDRQATFASADNLPFSLWSNRDALSFAWMVHHHPPNRRQAANRGRACGSRLPPRQACNPLRPSGAWRPEFRVARCSGAWRRRQPGKCSKAEASKQSRQTNQRSEQYYRRYCRPHDGQARFACNNDNRIFHRNDV